jgi:hypothetical protein
LRTLDTDVAVPIDLPESEENIRARLLAHGFVEDLMGDSRPPATHYRLGSVASGFYVEFLTPLIGSQYNREQQRKTTIEVAGIVSQQLRYIEILLRNSWTIELSLDDRVARVQIANPVSFLAQKVLIQGRRSREDRARDLLYMHDTLEVFANRLGELQELWRGFIAPELPARSARQVKDAARSLFGDVTDDIRRASEIAAAATRSLSPEVIRAAGAYGFDQVFV